MAVTGAVNNNSPTTGLAKSMGGGDTLDKDSFLLLLVTQFKYQDPLNPMEDKEFIAQLAQFTALEQQMSTNAQMEKLVTLQTQQQMIGAVSYIGKEVSARGFGVAVSEGEATLVQYANSEEMTKGYINIFDGNNQLVTTVNINGATPGIHDFRWDCKKANGSIVPNGVYTVSISGENAAGESILVDTSVTGKVTGVSLSDGEQILTLSDGRLVALSYVRQVQDSAAATSKSSWTSNVKEGVADAVWFKSPVALESVDVSIYNAAGKLVASEKLEEKTAGTHSYKWNGKTVDDEVAPDGEYLISFEAKDEAGKVVELQKV